MCRRDLAVLHYMGQTSPDLRGEVAVKIWMALDFTTPPGRRDVIDG